MQYTTLVGGGSTVSTDRGCLEANCSVALVFTTSAPVAVGEVLSCTNRTSREDGGFGLVVSKLEAGGRMGAHVNPEDGGYSRLSSKEEQFRDDISGIVAAINGFDP